ncbi:c-type cytochrome [Humidesulfovibrio idahonensis]
MRKTFAVVTLAMFLGAACATAPKTPAPEPAPEAKAVVIGGPKALYAAKCAGCHGADGSKGLKGKTSEYVVTALNGYKAMTYGGAKKAIMEKQASTLSDGDVQALADFIAGL